MTCLIWSGPRTRNSCEFSKSSLQRRAIGQVRPDDPFFSLVLDFVSGLPGREYAGGPLMVSWHALL